YLKTVTPAQALTHPNWEMGAKITIDSGTLMNKGLELIEAVWLFNVKPEQVEVIIHRESIIHSMVEFVDNAVIAELSKPDMRECIQYAITYPKRMRGLTGELNFFELSKLTFQKPDEKTFTLLPLARECIKKGGNLPAALNGANEAAVNEFLQGKISFTDIFDKVASIVNSTAFILNPTLDDIFDTDREARSRV
ncbi:MAG: 1-deoxy-D-xylulose-5-phosphate reductoisomerase, partial [Clostridia bacterium]